MRAIAHCQEPRSSWTVAMQGPRTTEGMTAMASNWPESAAILVVIFSVITFALLRSGHRLRQHSNPRQQQTKTKELMIAPP